MCMWLYKGYWKHEQKWEDIQERERPGKPKNDESVKFCWKLREDGGLKMFSGVNMLPMDLGETGNQIEGKWEMRNWKQQIQQVCVQRKKK